MFRKFSSLVILVCTITAASALSSKAQTITASVPGGVVTKGKATRATVLLVIPAGLHVNSNRPDSEYAIATTVRASANGARIGAVSYPRGKNRKFQFSENLINVYEGRVLFTFPVTVPANYRGSTVKLDIAVRYQACTDEVCYPPRTKTISVNARVR
jgi:thiol:disulfide interchange protein